MKIKLTPKLKDLYPNVEFGSLVVRNVQNRKKNEALEKIKRNLEKKIRDFYTDMSKDSLIQDYNRFFKKWGKTYPIEYQITTIQEGRGFPQVSVLVDVMFLAELKNRILTSGHDLDEIQGDLTFDVLEGNEFYLKLNNQEQKTKKNDICVKDDVGILACVLYGPAKRTTISPKTRNALYFAWCPYGIGEEAITAHLKDILSNLRIEYEELDTNIQVHTK